MPGTAQNKRILKMLIKKGSLYAAKEDDDLFTEDEALFTSDLVYNSGLIIDSGATQHMTYEKDQLFNYVEFKQPCTVNLRDDRSILAYGKGTYRINSNTPPYRVQRMPTSDLTIGARGAHGVIMGVNVG